MSNHQIRSHKNIIITMDDDEDDDSDDFSDDERCVVKKRPKQNLLNTQEKYDATSNGNNTESANCDCYLDLLRVKPFSSLSAERQNELIEKGRPTPELTCARVKKGKGNYKFQPIWYARYTWLTACLKTQRMYCWPCVLFTSSKLSSWGDPENGVSDLTNFCTLRRRHVCTKDHVSCLVKLARFRKSETNLEAFQSAKLDCRNHNNIVQSNRFVLSRIIDAICFLASREKKLIGQTNDLSTFSAATYAGDLYSLCKTDVVLTHHVENSTVFNEPVVEIANDLIEAITKVVYDHTKSEIFHCNFVSLNLSEYRDASAPSLSSVVVRYVTNNEVCERFVRFEEKTERSAEQVLETVKSTAKEFDCETKLICVTYDGAAVKPALGTTAVRPNYHHQTALFLPCRMHSLSLVFQQNVRCISQCHVFFQWCTELSTFFTNSSSLSETLETLLSQSDLSGVYSDWTSQLITVLYARNKELKVLLTGIINSEKEWNTEQKTTATRFLSILEDKEFRFLLTLFAQLLPKAEILFNQLQPKLFDVRFCQMKMDEFSIELNELRESLEEEWEESPDFEDAPPIKCQKLSDDFTPQGFASEILDNVKTCLRERYGGFKDWDFLVLLNTEEFPKLLREFPKKAFHTLQRLYEEDFDFGCLMKELQALYAEKACYGKSLALLHDYLIASDLDKALPQVCKLVDLFLCFPLTSVGSTCEQVMVDHKNRPCRSDLNLLSIDKLCLQTLNRSPTFYDRVIDRFRTMKARRLELEYR